MTKFLNEIKTSLFPQREQSKDIWQPVGEEKENADLQLGSFNEPNSVIRISEVECKTIDRAEIDSKMITEYCHQLGKVFLI